LSFLKFRISFIISTTFTEVSLNDSTNSEGIYNLNAEVLHMFYPFFYFAKNITFTRNGYI
jgi:hypothetical protein